jgi:hypothetical protein
MFLPFGRKAKFEKLLQELKTAVFFQMVKFATIMPDEIEKLAAQGLLNLGTKPRAYPRFSQKAALQKA